VETCFLTPGEKMTNTWIGFSWIDHLGVLPHSGRLLASFLAGAFFFSKITRPWNIEPHLGDFQIFRIKKNAESHQKLGPPIFSP